MTAGKIREEIRRQADPAHAQAVARYFKTGPSEYGEGDVFLGLRTPHLREIARRHRGAGFDALAELLSSPVHEDRFAALAILDDAARRATESEHERLARFYLAHTAGVDNWDLVDCSAPHVLGGWLARRSGPAAAAEAQAILDELAASPVMWHRRIAVLATFAFIRDGRLMPVFSLVEQLMDDPHDLMHKAMGWMLREARHRDEQAVLAFLDTHLARLPRTTVRYAVERLPADVRTRYVPTRASQSSSRPASSSGRS